MTIYNSLNFVRETLLLIFDFFFNTFRIPTTSTVYMGWVIISAIAMGIIIKTILNIPRSIPSIKKERQGSQNGQ